MQTKYTVISIVLLLVLVVLCVTCKKQRSEKPPDPTYAQIEREYGKTVAQASIDFKTITTKDSKFYQKGGKMSYIDTLLPCIRFGMPKTKVEALLGKPGTRRILQDEEWWSYTLFYSQAIDLVFDVHGKLIKIDGYGREKWRKVNIDLLITQLKKGMTENEVSLIFGPPDRVAHSIDGLITTLSYDQIAPSPITIEFDNENLKSVSGYGKELWGKQKGE